MFVANFLRQTIERGSSEVGGPSSTVVSLLHKATSHYSAEPILRFKNAVKTVMVLLKATKYTGTHVHPDSRMLSFSQFQDSFFNSKITPNGQNLAFDPLSFRAHKEAHLNSEAKAILCMEPEHRTEQQLHVVLLALQRTVDAFSEFPVSMQRSLAKVGWYEHFESKRVIIRQGHTADNFYFILSGTAVVTILERHEKKGEPFVRTAAFLGKGNSFGELAIMHAATRSATVTCKDDVELLAVGRDDFIDIFMHVEKNLEPDHIKFLRSVDVLQGWPVDLLPWDDTRICVTTYFRRGVLMCRDMRTTDWVYIIKSGSCSVLKTLTYTTPDIPGLHKQPYLPLIITPTTRPRGLVMRHHNNRRSTPEECALNSSIDEVTEDEDRTARPTHDRSTARLPPIRTRHTQKKDAIIKQHQKLLDVIFRDRHKASDDSMPRQSSTQEVTSRKGKQRLVVAKILSLVPKQTFGLEAIAFAGMEETPSVSLVSEGAEAVLINRKFFITHLSDDVKKRLRSTIQPYPSTLSLQQKLQNNTNWDAFKTMTVNDQMSFNRYVHCTLKL